MIESQRVNTVTDHGCFGCGSRNPIGLRLEFYRDDLGVQATFTPAIDHQGYTQVTHGGIVSAVLDEAMSWAVISTGRLAMTARLSIHFRRPVPTGQPLTVRGIVERDRGRVVETRGEIRDADGELLASSTGTFMRVSDRQQQEWETLYFPDSGA